MKNFKMVLMFTMASLAMAVTFQNCAKTPTSQIADTTVVLGDSGLQCPLYSEPQCSADEEITIVDDECGGHPVCTPKLPTKNCPLYQRPICSIGETLVVVSDANGCPMPKCVSKKTPISCPLYQRPLCEVGEVLISVTDSNGCPMPVCSLSK